MEYPFCSLAGDIDHDGYVGVKDVLLLRIYIDKGIEKDSLCLVCADTDGNLDINEKDLEAIREIVLHQAKK